MNVGFRLRGPAAPIHPDPSARWPTPGLLADARPNTDAAPLRRAFWILSDLRIDLAPGLALPDPLPDFDMMLVAGNIGPDLGTSLRWLATALGGRQGDRPVCVVPGNVDYRGGVPLVEALARGRELAATLGIVLLSDDAIRFGPPHGDGTVVIGSTLWTDWRLGELKELPRARVLARTASRDSVEIMLRRDRVLSPLDTLAMHARSRAFIEDALTSAIIGSLGFPHGPNACAPVSRPGDVAVVLTCHAPTPRSLPDDWEGWNPGEWLPASLASEASTAMDAWGAPPLWAHGNVPAPADHRVGKTRVVANPRVRGHGFAAGTAGGALHASFDPALVVAV